MILLSKYALCVETINKSDTDITRNVHTTLFCVFERENTPNIYNYTVMHIIKQNEQSVAGIEPE